jgi:hypothetical protein
MVTTKVLLRQDISLGKQTPTGPEFKMPFSRK